MNGGAFRSCICIKCEIIEADHIYTANKYIMRLGNARTFATISAIKIAKNDKVKE